MNLKPFVNNRDLYPPFQEWVEAQIEHLHKRLESAKDPSDFYRVQGQITTYRVLQRLREDVNAMEK